ncbi:MAG: response regulator [Chloroflexi bacterium]|nr:response regulator [Chloroflexota bacterium]
MSERVLVVDDDDSIRELVSLALSDEGYDVVSAPDGAMAFDLIAERQPNVILLDLRMPIMDGWEFLDAYRKRPGPHAPVIALTAAREVGNTIPEIGADAFLSKPFDLEDLLNLVDHHLHPLTGDPATI